MNLQYILDNSGNKTAVVIPISEWKKITKKYKDIESKNDSSNNNQMSKQEFKQWIEKAENETGMTLEEFNESWQKNIQKIKKLIV